MEEMVQFTGNGTMGDGFLARPDEPGTYPAVIVIQEWWGLNEQIKDTARRYANVGFVALAPDLYHGKVVREPDEADKAMMEMDKDRAVREIVAAIDYLRAQDYVAPKRIGLTGYCMGGGLALIAMTATQNVGAVVAYYGGMSAPPEAYKDNQAPLLNILAEHDDWANANVGKLNVALDQLGYPFKRETVQYPGTEHAFCNDRRPEVYNEVACADAWERTISWFRAHLV